MSLGLYLKSVISSHTQVGGLGTCVYCGEPAHTIWISQCYVHLHILYAMSDSAKLVCTVCKLMLCILPFVSSCVLSLKCSVNSDHKIICEILISENLPFNTCRTRAVLTIGTLYVSLMRGCYNMYVHTVYLYVDF